MAASAPACGVENVVVRFAPAAPDVPHSPELEQDFVLPIDSAVHDLERLLNFALARPDSARWAFVCGEQLLAASLRELEHVAALSHNEEVLRVSYYEKLQDHPLALAALAPDPPLVLHLFQNHLLALGSRGLLSFFDLQQCGAALRGPQGAPHTVGAALDGAPHTTDAALDGASHTARAKAASGAAAAAARPTRVLRCPEARVLGLHVLGPRAFLVATGCGELFAFVGDVCGEHSFFPLCRLRTGDVLSAFAVNAECSRVALGTVNGRVWLFELHPVERATSSLLRGECPAQWTSVELAAPQLGCLRAHSAAVTVLQFCGDAAAREFLLLSAAMDATVALSDYLEARVLAQRSARAPLLSGALLPAGAALGAMDGSVSLWRWRGAQLECAQTFQQPRARGAVALHAAAAPDAGSPALLAACCNSGAVLVLSPDLRACLLAIGFATPLAAEGNAHLPYAPSCTLVHEETLYIGSTRNEITAVALAARAR